MLQSTRRARGLDQQRAQGHPDGPRLRPAPGTAGPPQQRDLERVALGRRQGGQELVGRVPDQVVQPAERQPRLALLAGAAQHAAPARRGLVERGEPDGGLADPGLPLDHERPRTGAQPAEERPREGELPVASDDAGVHEWRAYPDALGPPGGVPRAAARTSAAETTKAPLCRAFARSGRQDSTCGWIALGSDPGMVPAPRADPVAG